MKTKAFNLHDFREHGKHALDKLEKAVCEFCKDKDVVSITGNPTRTSARDIVSSDDVKGWNYSGWYVVWYQPDFDDEET